MNISRVLHDHVLCTSRVSQYYVCHVCQSVCVCHVCRSIMYVTCVTVLYMSRVSQRYICHVCHSVVYVTCATVLYMSSVSQGYVCHVCHGYVCHVCHSDVDFVCWRVYTRETELGNIDGVHFDYGAPSKPIYVYIYMCITCVLHTGVNSCVGVYIPGRQGCSRCWWGWLPLWRPIGARIYVSRFVLYMYYIHMWIRVFVCVYQWDGAVGNINGVDFYFDVPLEPIDGMHHRPTALQKFSTISSIVIVRSKLSCKLDFENFSLYGVHHWPTAL